MQKRVLVAALCLVFVCLLCAAASADGTWACSSCGSTGNTGNFCPNCGAARPAESWACPVCRHQNTGGNFCVQCGAKRTAASAAVYGLATEKLAINSGPGTRRYYDELGTYNVKGQYVRILAKAYDSRNDIWWVKCEIPNTKGVVGWTGYKRFDASSFNLNDVPTERW